jgi:hypothetical protein
VNIDTFPNVPVTNDHCRSIHTHPRLDTTRRYTADIMFKASRVLAMQPTRMMMMRPTQQMFMRASPQLVMRETLRMRSPTPVLSPEERCV